MRIIRRMGAVALCLILLCGSAMAAKVTVSGICFKYLARIDDLDNASVKVKGPVTAAQVEQALLSGAAYGINYKVTCKTPGSYMATILWTAPDGWSFPYTARMEFTRTENYVWFDCLGKQCFLAYFTQFGSIEPGEYTISLYLDDELKDVSTFTLN